MSISDHQANIDSLRKAAAVARNALTDAIIDACPGEHETKQHRDMRPPWCPHCGRNDYGRVVKHVDQ